MGEDMSQNDDDLMLKERLKGIKKKFVVLSGKGGVGKSTVSVNIACALAAKGFKTGLLDVDVHGPSVPTMLGLTGAKLVSTEKGIIPAEIGCIPNLKVLSVGFLLGEKDAPVVWRGPMKTGAIKQFIKDVEWGELDYLIVDCPPGTGDEPLTIAQTLTDAKAIVVTTPQEVSLSDVRKSISFCKLAQLEILGLIENMSGFVCPDCGSVHNIFKSGGGEKLAQQQQISFLGKLPIDPAIVESEDAGDPAAMSEPAREALKIVVKNVIAQTKQ